MTDPRKNTMLFISKAYERIWGRSCESLIERPMSFIESIHPVDREAVIAAFPKQKEGSYDIEYRIVRSDGDIRWIRDKAFPIRDKSGEIYRVVGVAQDITDHKDAEERFRQVTDTIDEVFWMTDPRKNTMLFISKAYERIWGRTCASLIERPMSFIDSIHPQDRDAVIAAFPRQKEGTYDIEYRIIRSDGDLRWIRDTAFPVRNASGEIYRVVGVAQDITENKNLIRDLNAEKERTEHLLENILPKSIIGVLKGEQRVALESPVIAQRIDDATVLFADLVGFTRLRAIAGGGSRRRSAQQDRLHLRQAGREARRREDQDHRRLLHGGRRRAGPPGRPRFARRQHGAGDAGGACALQRGAGPEVSDQHRHAQRPAGGRRDRQRRNTSTTCGATP